MSTETGEYRPFISVVVATYNRPRELAAVLRALAKQSADDFEVVVADDGSGPETARMVGEAQERWPGRIAHVWHEDRGFRLAEIRNRAIVAARGKYIVFLDGDCIPPTDFVARHRRLAEPGRMVYGQRLLLSQPFSAAAIDGALPIEEWSLADWLGPFRRGAIPRLVPLLRLPDGRWRHLTGRHRQNRVFGCNMAVWHADLLRVDGFDCDFVGWGHEDNDIAWRLDMSGVALKDGRLATAVFHLWHERADASRQGEHWRRIAAARSAGRVRPLRGLSSLAGEDAASAGVSRRPPPAAQTVPGRERLPDPCCSSGSPPAGRETPSPPPPPRPG